MNYMKLCIQYIEKGGIYSMLSRDAKCFHESQSVGCSYLGTKRLLLVNKYQCCFWKLKCLMEHISVSLSGTLFTVYFSMNLIRPTTLDASSSRYSASQQSFLHCLKVMLIWKYTVFTSNLYYLTDDHHSWIKDCSSLGYLRRSR